MKRELNNEYAIESEQTQETYTKIKWSIIKLIFAGILLIAGSACIYLGLQPLIEMELNLKSFANLVFVIFHIYYAISLFGVKRMSQFIFWCGSYILLISASLMFFYYDSIFI
ncbi:leptin receptor gene-related protein [Nosema bombycis CQ1]|uniref:Leptin receptor gene-related protein n=1 Tax=Nosema bombycis (strain CQ1 / CVCC 102059) TaxID=578461 RepID=R0MGF7_NOSB1|nr:leptin receptor gene-related protein [Nosema bombycis CQ1]|eukprot:EOB11833.1 leptin receptor gene-related protein [Nosema bombycis CQ1]